MKSFRAVAGATLLTLPLLAGLSASAEAAPAKAKAAPVAKKPRLNNKKPKGFKRYNAPGVVNVDKYIYPRKEYLGVSAYDMADEQNPMKSIAGAQKFAKTIGRKPNMIKEFYNIGDPFNPAWANAVWQNGAIPQFQLEAWPKGRDLTLANIAGGEWDEYFTQLATDIKTANIPIAFSFAHEFNADWYPWGTCARPEQYENNPGENACDYDNTPQQYVAAWRHIHDIFRDIGATNAIWMWQPNHIGPRPEIGLKQYFPGKAYIDWVGVVAYYRGGYYKKSFERLFVPTFKQVRTFTKAPIIIPEVSVSGPPTIGASTRAKYIKDFLAGINTYPNVIGFIWFNVDKTKNEADGEFRLEVVPSSVTAFRAGLKKGYFGFKVK